MLTKLRVKNYALIKELDINFGEGLSIITGETGAGKSILLGALSLILGSRADTGILLDKEYKCVVEGTFKIEGYNLENLFIENDIDFDALTTVRREINPAGKSRAFINDTPVNLNLLKELGNKLIDIHSQHQTLMLNDNFFQLQLLDSFADTNDLLQDYRRSYNKYKSLLKEYTLLKENVGKNQSDYDYFSFQYNQLNDAKLVEGELEELESEQELLTHAEEVKENLTAASEYLTSDNGSVLSFLKEVKSCLAKSKRFFSSGNELFERVESSYIELNDIATEIERQGNAVEANSDRLIFVSDRLDTLYSLMQKHKVSTILELITKKTEIRTLLESIETSDERLKEIEGLIVESKKGLQALASTISSKRKSITSSIEQRIIQLLKQLGIINARFEIVLSRLTDFSINGIDQADFLFSANKQVEPENLAKVASGGELSRVMLSLKSLLSKNNNLPTIIFDEIDSGVSGEVADKVGTILSDMGEYMQVINITHLPQVAARGKRHFHVYKDNSGMATVTRIKELNDDERVIEIARMLSGKEVTDAAILNAKVLLHK